MSRSLIGHERTRARRAVEALRLYDPGIVAQLLGMRRHTVAAILSGRMLPGRTFAERTSGIALEFNRVTQRHPAVPPARTTTR